MSDFILGLPTQGEEEPFAGRGDGVADSASGQFQEPGGARISEPGLDRQAKDWPTPTCRPEATNNSLKRENGRIANRFTNQCLEEVAQEMSEWPTPDASDSIRGLQARDGKRGIRLGSRAKEFPIMPTDQPSLFSLQVPETSKSGEPSLASTPSSRRRLNPVFVEWLMGWPPGSTGSGCSETECFHWMRHMRSYLFGLVFEMAEAAQ